MDNQKLSAILYIAAGGVFCISAFLGGNLFTLCIGGLLIILGIQRLKNIQ